MARYQIFGAACSAGNRSGGKRPEFPARFLEAACGIWGKRFFRRARLPGDARGWPLCLMPLYHMKPRIATYLFEFRFFFLSFPEDSIHHRGKTITSWQFILFFKVSAAWKFGLWTCMVFALQDLFVGIGRSNSPCENWCLRHGCRLASVPRQKLGELGIRQHRTTYRRCWA